MSILFERRVDASLDSQHDQQASAPVSPAADAQQSALADDRIDQLEQEVDHLRACIDQLLDIVDNQFDPSGDMSLLADRMSLFERRMQRVEEGVSDMHRNARRRAGDR